MPAGVRINPSPSRDAQQTRLANQSKPRVMSSGSEWSESALSRRLGELNGSAQSIQQTSQWLIQHHKHHATIVKLWLRELESRASPSRKLACLYLANDVVQNGRKKAPKLGVAFGPVVTKAMDHLAAIKNIEPKTLKDVARLVNIWKERKIFESRVQADIDKAWSAKMAKGDKTEAKQKDKSSPGAKRPSSSAKDQETPKKARVSSGSVETASSQETTTTTSTQSDLLLLSPSASPGATEAPDADTLLAKMNELEHSASSDGVVREKIARLPPQVSDISHLPKVKTAQEGEKLLEQIKEASAMLTTYNSRLEQELKDRKQFSRMLHSFVNSQRALEAQTEEKLEEYKEKFERAKGVRDELKLHVQSLPDLSKLPDVTAGTLAPLPSAGDLFTLK